MTGLSGAGKTTLGNKLYYQMKQQEIGVVLLDGDILKRIISQDGYTREDRLERGYRYSALCKLLTDQGVNVIICTIAMFDEIRQWNRENIDKYIEIFLDVELEVLKERNRKGLYSQKDGNVAGIDVTVEYPKNPDIVIKNNGKHQLNESVMKILNYQVIPKEKRNDDGEYWDKYYARESGALSEPSLFARTMFCKYMQKEKDLIELGCGNGRDSIYFAENGLYVIGIDSSQIAIKELQNKNICDNCTFVCDDFVDIEALYQAQYDYCYSRFTLHAINEQEETRVLSKAYSMLKEEGLLFIEARSVHDGKYGLGQKVEKNAFILDGHYRRFIDLPELLRKLQDIGFAIVEQEESDEFAPLKGDNAVCIRVVAQRTGGVCNYAK